MRYRKLSQLGDYSFGHSRADIWQDTPEGIAQAVKTRLALWTGEWLLDVTEGMPWNQSVLGWNQTDYDSEIRSRILDTDGVTEIVDYSSVIDRNSRHLSISATISTTYGNIDIVVIQPISGSKYLISDDLALRLTDDDSPDKLLAV